jgi:ketosteroid isomerase-like protein
MSEENVKLVRAGFEAWSRGGVEPLLELIDSDVEWTVQEFIEAGADRVVVPLHWGGRGKLSGAEVAERQGETWVFTVENEKVTRVTEYRRKAEALEAAGLSE